MFWGYFLVMVENVIWRSWFGGVEVRRLGCDLVCSDEVGLGDDGVGLGDGDEVGLGWVMKWV